MKTIYKGFKIGQKVVLNTSFSCEGKHFDKGHNFDIISFPYCVVPGKYQNFVFGSDNQNNVIRCDIDQIEKLLK